MGNPKTRKHLNINRKLHLIGEFRRLKLAEQYFKPIETERENSRRIDYQN